MDIDLLKTFVEASKTQHFGKAAENLFITQSAVSARIRLLENQLACQLFQRNNKKVSLSREGKLFLDHAEKIIHQWHTAKAALKQTSSPVPSYQVASPSCLWQLGLTNIGQYLNGPVQLCSFSYDLLANFIEHYKGCIISTPHPLLEHYDKMVLGELELLPLSAKHHAQAKQLTYTHIPWGYAYERFATKQGFKNHSHHHTDQIPATLALLNRQPAFVYLPRCFHVQSDNLTILQSYKTITLPVALYSLPTSSAEERNTVFNYAQQTLMLTNNNKR